MKQDPLCAACKDACSDMARRFDPCLRWVCSPCYEFLQYAEKAMRKAGIEGVIGEPNPETEKP